MSDYSYPAELIKLAEKRIRDQMDGNGTSVGEINLTVQKAGSGEFTARTWYDVDCRVDITHEKGKKSRGRLVSPGQLDHEVKLFRQALSKDRSLQNLGKERIKSLPLEGFGSDKDVIELPSQTLVLTEHSPCGACRGQGKTGCPYCQSRGQRPCPQCHAMGSTTCQFCFGRGQVQQGDQMKSCVTCHGRGQVLCTLCHGQKQTSCTNCQAKGTISCGACGGEGIQSSHASLTPFLRTACAINIQELDDEPKRMAAKIGGLALAKGGHIDVVITKAPDAEDDDTALYEERLLHPQNDQSVYYRVRMPWAIASVDLNDKAYAIRFCGKKGAIAESGKFMDDLLQPAFDLFEKAAQDGGFVAVPLEDAAKRYRVSRETLVALTTMKPAKAMYTISKAYPIGLSKPFIQAFVQNAQRALNRLTFRPRIIGMIAGLIAAILVNYGWFMMDWRLLVPVHDPMFKTVADILPLPAGLLIVTASIKMAGMLVVDPLMKAIGQTARKTPPMGKIGIAGVIGVLIVWGAFFAAGCLGLL